MSTEGKFYVENSSNVSITGSVTYHDRPESRINFTNLKPGESTPKKSFSSGAGTKDSWYYDYSQGNNIRKGDKDCAFYDKDQAGPVVISIGDNSFKVSPDISGSCVKDF
ncbi:hypothetical protein [Photobacterium minamisatsumaniensis]|uniref:hypothetical protein n=1 Tax=Photobacterium minamisatsumaniensis TaxID=2910233 RepID=UPI003D13AA45